MLIHITPTFILDLCKVRLANLHIPDIGLDITDNDLKTCTPYPNKRLFVACKKGRSNYAGVLIETQSFLQSFTVDYKWVIDEEIEVGHKIQFELLDHDYDFVSDQMLFWGDRTPDFLTGVASVQYRPHMELFSKKQEHRAVEDKLEMGFDNDEPRFIRERSELYKLPTIPRSRLTNKEFLIAFAKMPTDIIFSSSIA